MNIWQSIETATWNARGLGPTCPSESLPVHSGLYHSLASENCNKTKQNEKSLLDLRTKENKNNPIIVEYLNKIEEALKI